MLCKDNNTEPPAPPPGPSVSTSVPFAEGQNTGPPAPPPAPPGPSVSSSVSSAEAHTTEPPAPPPGPSCASRWSPWFWTSCASSGPSGSVSCVWTQVCLVGWVYWRDFSSLIDTKVRLHQWRDREIRQVHFTTDSRWRIQRTLKLIVGSSPNTITSLVEGQVSRDPPTGFIYQDQPETSRFWLYKESRQSGTVFIKVGECMISSIQKRYYALR